MNTSLRNTPWSTKLGLAAAGTAVLLTGCKIPPNFTWQDARQRGILNAIYHPEGSTVKPLAAPGSRVVKVDAVMTPKVVNTPFAEVIPGRAGYVYSPFMEGKRIVDVRAFRSGEEARCPYTLKTFLVPDYHAPGLAQNIPATQPAAGTDVVSTDPAAGLDQLHGGPAERLGPPKPENLAGDPATAGTKPTPGDIPRGLPFGRRVSGRPGFVYSPYAAEHQLVDVAGIAPGVEVKCPYTGKLFRVPEMLAAETTPPAAVAEREKSTPPVPSFSQPKVADETPKPLEKPLVVEDKQDKPKQPGRVQPGSLGSRPPRNPEPGEAAPTPAPAPKPAEEISVATWAQKDKGLVQSPHGQPGQLVDVTGMPPGSKVVCPFTGKPFIVPVK